MTLYTESGEGALFLRFKQACTVAIAALLRLKPDNYIAKV